MNWQLGYQGVLLGEYFLRTGDRAVLDGLQELCDWCVENQAAGGWSHGAPVGPGYVQSGLMNHAGLPILVGIGDYYFEVEWHLIKRLRSARGEYDA